MRSTFTKICILLVGLGNLGATGYFFQKGYHSLQSLPRLPVQEVAAHGHPVSGGHGEGLPHGDRSPTSHSPKSDSDTRSWVTLEEMFVNVLGEQDKQVHTLAFKLEVELFEEASRQVMETRGAVVKNAVLELARLQPYESLSSLAGKLYFKEALVARVNDTVRFPLIRDVHLAAFSLQ